MKLLCRKLRRGRRPPAGRASDAPAGREGGLFAEMRPCVWTLWAFQIWPLFEEDGRVVFRKRSLYFAYAVASWTGTTYIALRALIHWYSVIQSAGYFSLKAYYAWFFLVGHFSIAIPLLFWTNMRGVAEAFNYAQRFQVNFREVTGHRLSFGVAKKARVTAALCPVVGLAFVLWSHDAGYVPWNQFPVYEMNATYLAILPETWVLIALALETAAQRLRAELVQVLGDVGEAADSGPRRRALADLRWLWMQLQHLVRMWSLTWTPCLAHLILSSVTVLLLSVFGISLPLLRGQVIDDRLAGMMTAVVHNIYNINRVCSAGSRVRREDAFVKEMTRAKFATASTNLYPEVIENKLKSESTSSHLCPPLFQLVKFLKAVDIQDPCLDMGGFTSLNRALAVGVC
ncbi:gustatory and odorant receptor 63a-like isoform X2 [Frankliniella occidentalis]|uniref:Gustatory and odorant receptor 63a-like isoform X2 n=1 Tax=Frankliniella occidentalis TaxID=133901 RepID=A0A9C6X1F1_FRAOC|nr:gustatory and odorant receptor 63a-like isoform X2 [Frankliniella occidentalis]